MGQTKGGGYQRIPTTTSAQQTLLDQFLAQAGQNSTAASDAFKSFLPGGAGGQAITNQANQNFQQQTLPSIFNAYGVGNKGSSSLNQALSAGASNLNSDIAAQLAQMQFGAAQGLGNLAQGQGQLGSQQHFALQQRPQPFWQSYLLANLQGAGNAAKTAAAFA